MLISSQAQKSHSEQMKKKTECKNYRGTNSSSCIHARKQGERGVERLDKVRTGSCMHVILSVCVTCRQTGAQTMNSKRI